MFDAVVGRLHDGRRTRWRGELIDRLEPGMLVLADRGFCGFPLWQRAVATGADLLWRANAEHEAPLRSRRSPTARGWPSCARRATPGVTPSH